MAQLTHEQYDELERAVRDGSRISVYRRGTEYVVIPARLRMIEGKEAIEAINPTTGDRLTLYLDDLDSIDLVR